MTGNVFDVSIPNNRVKTIYHNSNKQRRQMHDDVLGVGQGMSMLVNS